MSIDTKILEQRLVTKDSVLAASSISRTAARLASIRSSCTGAPSSSAAAAAAAGTTTPATPTTTAGSSTSIEAFIRELFLFKFELDKSCRVYSSYEQQVREYDQLEARIASTTNNTVAEIQLLKTQLMQAKKIREHRIICEEYAQEVNKHKNRSLLKRKIVQLEENVNEATKKVELINSDIKTRKSQFDSLLTALLDLESQIIQTNKGENGDDSDDENHDNRGQRRDNEEEDQEVPTEEIDCVGDGLEGEDVGEKVEEADM